MPNRTITRKKVLILGDKCTGKSCLFLAATSNTFHQMYEKTVFHDYSYNVFVDRKMVPLSLWDVENYDNMTRPDVAVLCFSIENTESFEHILRIWLPKVRMYQPKVPLVLVANKIDLRNNQRIINYLNQMNKQFITTNKLDDLGRLIGACATIECSAKTRDGVKDLFETVARIASTKQHQNCCLIS